jgi:hypothetical protein
MTQPRPPRQSPLTPGYTWSEPAARYRDSRTGRFVGKQQVRGALDKAIDSSAKSMKALAQQLRDGNISLADWQVAMAREIKSTHLASAALAKGGWAQLNQSDYGRVGQIVRQEYAYLSKLAADIAAGKQPLDGRFLRRAESYIQAGRATYHAIEQREMKVRGFDEERNLRHARDSCPGCVDATARGWVTIGTLPPVGSRDCRRNCRCTIEYRKAAA